MGSFGDVGGLLATFLKWTESSGWAVDIVTLGELEPCEQLRAMHDASIAVTVYGTEQYVTSAFLPERAALILLHTTKDSNATAPLFDAMRGPGMKRNASVADRFRTLCGGR